MQRPKRALRIFVPSEDANHFLILSIVLLLEGANGVLPVEQLLICVPPFRLLSSCHSNESILDLHDGLSCRHQQ